MDELCFKIQSSLDERAMLLNKASFLEEQAKILRKQVGSNDLKDGIESVHMEIFNLLDRIDLLYDLISLAWSLYGSSSEEQIPISLDTYQALTFQGKSIEMIEKELFCLTKRIKDYCELLEQICSYTSHNYRFIKTEKVFDFDSLEVSFEEKNIHYCAICGSATALDLDKKIDFDSSLIERLEKLRKARKMQVYVSKFIIQENLSR